MPRSASREQNDSPRSFLVALSWLLALTAVVLGRLIKYCPTADDASVVLTLALVSSAVGLLLAMAGLVAPLGPRYRAVTAALVHALFLSAMGWSVVVSGSEYRTPVTLQKLSEFVRGGPAQARAQATVTPGASPDTPGAIRAVAHAMHSAADTLTGEGLEPAPSPLDGLLREDRAEYDRARKCFAAAGGMSPETFRSAQDVVARYDLLSAWAGANDRLARNTMALPQRLAERVDKTVLTDEARTAARAELSAFDIDRALMLRDLDKQILAHQKIAMQMLYHHFGRWQVVSPGRRVVFGDPALTAAYEHRVEQAQMLATAKRVIEEEMK